MTARRRTIGVTAAAGALLTLGITVPPAQADIDDLFQPHGVLLDQANGAMVFGDNPLAGGTTVDGSPYATLLVSIDGQPPQSVSAVIDSGGVYGTMPSSVLGNVTPTASGYLPDGTTVQVYSADGSTLLYSYTVNSAAAGSLSPSVVSGSDATMNTGNIPFAQRPVYISYTNGSTLFGGSNAIEL